MRHEAPQGLSPTEVFRERILCCFIEDRVGVQLLDHFNVDNVCWESDYPHSDSSWPDAPERLETLFAGLDRDVIDTDHAPQRDAPLPVRPVRDPPARALHGRGSLRAEATDVDTVTRVGRPADERDLETWRTLTTRRRE